MKSTRWILAALMIMLMSMSAMAQDDPFVLIKSYDFQNRQPAYDINKMIHDNLGDKAKLAEIEKKLAAILADPQADPAAKQEVCKMLWQIGTKISVPILSKMLYNPDLSNNARFALERDLDPSAGKALRIAMVKTSGTMQVGIINSVGDRGDPLAVGELKKLAGSKNALVSQASIAALGKIPTSAALDSLLTISRKNPMADQAVVGCADRIANLGELAKAWKAFQVMAQNGKPSEVRVAAIRGLIATHSPQALKIAMEGLKSDDGYVQVSCAHLIGFDKNPQFTAKSLAVWPDLTAHLQAVMLTALAERSEMSAAGLVMKALKSDDPELRMAGINSVPPLHAAEAVPILANFVTKGGDEGQSARNALIMLPGAEGEKMILNLTKEGTPPVRAALLGLLAERPTASTKAYLMEAARGSEPQSAAAALNVLAQMGGPQDMDSLVKILVTTDNDNVRDSAQSAVVAVAQRMDNHDQAAAPLLTAYDSASSPAKISVIGALAQIGGAKALDSLIKDTQSSDADIKQAAVSSLADTWSDSRPLSTLMGIAINDSSKSMRVMAVRGALRLIKQDEGLNADQKVNMIGEIMRIAERPEEKWQALSVLRDCRTDSAVQLASKSLDDPNLFSEAADTILYLAAPQKNGNTQLPAVKSDAMSAALDKIIQLTKDDNQKALAQKLK
jgi:HEAT repeat protein